ncbi:MAG: fxsA cytoplasmic rane family protein [Micavibrio sp.]|nr:fxsA cytoplasmic rane family protein [Micavibrio sp.]
MPYVALFLLWPFLEIALFGRVGAAFGAGPVILLCILAALAGGFLIQVQGLKTMAALRRTATGGQMPGQEIFDGFCYFIAGILLIIPGFLSDFIAIGLLIPQLRAILRRRLSPYVAHNGQTGPNPAGTRDYIIEGEFTRVDDHDKPMLQPDTDESGKDR